MISTRRLFDNERKNIITMDANLHIIIKEFSKIIFKIFSKYFNSVNDNNFTILF